MYWLSLQKIMKLYATSQKGLAGRSKGIGSDDVLTTNYKIGNKEIGNVSMRYEDGDVTLYYYPITETTGKDGRILLHEESRKKEWCKCDSNPTIIKNNEEWCTGCGLELHDSQEVELKTKSIKQKSKKHCDDPEGCSYCDIDGKPMS